MPNDSLPLPSQGGRQVQPRAHIKRFRDPFLRALLATGLGRYFCSRLISFYNPSNQARNGSVAVAYLAEARLAVIDGVRDALGMPSDDLVLLFE